MSTSLAVVSDSTPKDHSIAAVADYVAGLANPVALKNQQALAMAYDAACAALIGPNDVQQEGGRSFKKKSAWRKLARHFTISVSASLDSVKVETTPDGFVAMAVATASAPWGQSWTDVGACASDEATGRRIITIADAIATAMTRASNRAVSNLIAMGEVSAEEVVRQHEANRGGRSSNKPNAEKLMPFGDYKGQKLGDIPTPNLESTLKWCREKKKDDLASAIEDVLTSRSLGADEDEADMDRDDMLAGDGY